MTVQELLRQLIELPRDMEVLVAAYEIEEVFLRVDEVDVDRYRNRLTLVLLPKEKGYIE